MTNGYLKASMITLIVLALLHIARYVILLVAYEDMIRGELVDLEDYFEVVTDEWNQKMITGMYLTKDKTQCADPAYLRTWAGTKKYKRGASGGSAGKGVKKET